MKVTDVIEPNRFEFKRTYTQDIVKEIVVFANSDAGEISVGVDDNGSIVGIDEPDDVSARISNMLRGAISPDIRLITDVKITFQQNKSLIHITFRKGYKRPYTSL